jgi:Arc/MetJ family transcription regulator
MRTNIDIDDAVLAAAMQSGAYKTKKEVVEAGLRLVARQAAYREILRWEGRLHWDGDDFSAEPPATALQTGTGAPAGAQLQEPAAPAARRRHAGR